MNYELVLERKLVIVFKLISYIKYI